MRPLDTCNLEDQIDYAMRTDRVIGRNIGILGAARSGVAAAMLLKRYNANVFVSESRNMELVLDAAQLFEANGIEFETGGNTNRVFKGRDYVVISPGVPSDAPIVGRIREAGIPIISEIELGFWMCDGRIVAVTGSNGKTTTTMLTGELFKHSGNTTFVAGNIGSPFSEVCDQIPRDGWAILEVSSFQLENCFEFRPNIAVILNLTPDHLDRYLSFDSYAETKMRIGENQDQGDAVVINHDDAYLVNLAASLDAGKHYFSITEKIAPGAFVDHGNLTLASVGEARKLMDVNEILLPGPHNLANCAAAAAVAMIADISDEVIRDVFSSFEGVEHRLESCGSIGDVRFINDSKATNVESVWYALQSVPGKLVLIMGGRDKGGEFTRLKGLIAEHAIAVVLIGEAADKIEKALNSIVFMQKTSSMEDAVRTAYRLAIPNAAVLLSPGCASFDMFLDYEHRGRVFKDAVSNLRKETES